MDTLTSLLFMAIAYSISKLWERYQSKENKNLHLPKPLVSETIGVAPKKVKKTQYTASTTETQSVMAVAKTQNVPSIMEEQVASQGTFDNNMIINGIIFAEILLPPRAYRPFTRRLK